MSGSTLSFSEEKQRLRIVTSRSEIKTNIFYMNEENYLILVWQWELSNRMKK